MILNVVKSAVMIHGPIPDYIPTFKFGDARVSIEEEPTYVGFTFWSTSHHILHEHYSIKVGKEQKIGNMVLALQSVIGRLPPWEMKRLYMALVDPHLTHGAGINLDVDLPLLKKLEEIQEHFLYRLLSIGSKSLSMFLFTETAT